MSPEAVGALIGLGVYLGMKLIDRMLPSGTHFKFVERWYANNKSEEDTE